VIRNVDERYLHNEWLAGPGETVTLKAMIYDFTRHLRLHLAEIDDLINSKS